MTRTRRLLPVLLAFLLPVAASAQGGVPTALPLWVAGAPGALGTDPGDVPSLTPYPAPAGSATGVAVVVLPGGGYRHLAMDHEGDQVARWLNSIGVSAFVVRYRLGPRYRHPTMLGDAQRAIRTVRARAGEWGIDPARVGILGFSAGGHLASTAATHFDEGRPGAADPVERAGSRPDFAILVYPVISMEEGVTHAGSRSNLLGEAPDARLVELLSNERQVTPRTPPTFLVHTADDAAVPVENSLRFYRALLEAGVPAEMHLYETGRHGFGLAPTNPVLSTWPALAAAWMASRGWLVAPVTPR